MTEFDDPFTRLEAQEQVERAFVGVPDAPEMIRSHDLEQGLTGEELTRFWENIGRGQGGFYDSIRAEGCSSCGSHTPGNCDGCA